MAKQYLDKDGVQQVWNAVDSKFMRSSGTATRPTYNGNDLALYSDIPSTAKNLYMHNIACNVSGTRTWGDASAAFTFSFVCSQSTGFSSSTAVANYIGKWTKFIASGTANQQWAAPSGSSIITEIAIHAGSAGTGIDIHFYAWGGTSMGVVTFEASDTWSSFSDSVTQII